MKHTPVTMAEGQATQERIAGVANRTPPIHLETDSPLEIYLKLENLQPIGSFKIRGAASKLMEWTEAPSSVEYGRPVPAIWPKVLLGARATSASNSRRSSPTPRLRSRSPLSNGSAGEFARLAASERYFEVFATRTFVGQEGMSVHAFSDHDVMAGNANIGLEILEDLPDVRALYVPYGGGGLSCGIASVLQAESPRTEIIACEPDTAAPLVASLAAGKPADAPFQSTFIDGAGGPHVFPEMFTLAQQLITGAASVPVDETAAAVRFLAERAHVVAEGAGALALAAAVNEAPEGSVVCIVSGGNINMAGMSEILAGRIPIA